MRKILFLSAVVMTMLASCSKEDEEAVIGPDPNDKYESSITLTATDLDLPADKGGKAIIRLTVDHEWYLVSNDKEEQTWLEADLTHGVSTKNKRITFTALEEGLAETRTAKFKIVSGANSKKFTVTQGRKCLILTMDDVQDFDKYYKPLEFDFDMLRSDSKWSWCRSKQTEHVVVFWDKQYGEYGLYGDRMGVANTSPTTCKSSKMRVDIDDLLKKAEEFYKINTETLKFSEPGTGKSVLDDYKFEIYILYQSEWLATGSGYDNMIGALWVNPSTCQPVGSTIAHEIGHTFQYMTFCDWLKNTGVPAAQRPYVSGNQGPGWRYGFDQNGAGGNAFWEQCAQWQSYQTYKDEAFENYNFGAFCDQTHLHVLHETPRYANYFIQWWWCHNNDDITFLAKMWRNAQYPEDPCETYMRLMEYDVNAFNDDIWNYAARCLTWDMDEIRNNGKRYIGRTAIPATAISNVDTDWWRISAAKAPESTGSNAVRMTAAAGQTVKVTLHGLSELAGCTVGPQDLAGWRYGFVSYNSDGTTTYSPIWSAQDTEQSFNVPANSQNLWFVVTGAPARYIRHPWGEDNGKPVSVWPWQAKFDGTKPYDR